MSEDVVKGMNLIERVFKQFVSGMDPHDLKINSSHNLTAKLVNKVVHELSHSSVFNNIRQHDMEYFCPGTDFRSVQIIKNVARKYLGVRMARYGQTYTKEFLQKNKLGKRRMLN